MWIEAWIDSAAKEDFTYVLLLRSRIDGAIELINPHAQNAIIQVFADYEAACRWLNEDEYDQIEGRWSND